MSGAYPRTVKSLFRGGYNVNCFEDTALYEEIKAIDGTDGIEALFPAIGAVQGLPIYERDILFTVQHDTSLKPINGGKPSRYATFKTPGVDNYSKVAIFGSLDGLQQVSKNDKEKARRELQKRIAFHSVNKKNVSADGTTTGFKGGTCSLVNNTPYPWKSQRLGMLRVPTDKEVIESRKYMDQRDIQRKRTVPIIVPMGRTAGSLSVLFAQHYVDQHTLQITREIANPVFEAFGTVLSKYDTVKFGTDPNKYVANAIHAKDPSALNLMAAMEMYADERAAIPCVKFEQDVGPGEAGVVKILA